ncbi:MAG TPA: mannonate dehydratase [Bacteroidota bacterium]|nr:mannonate dehydratase [Bacteroidota bacterium]
MPFEQTWRWFGPHDPVSLKEVKQAGAVGIVTALHGIPVGEVWPANDITKRKQMIEAEGLRWSVAESLPVHESIKKREGDHRRLIDNYKASVRNLGRCGIDTLCYNFMPVLDWSRTDLRVTFRDGSITTKFEMRAFIAFDLFILKRRDAEKSYSKKQTAAAKQFYDSLNESQKEVLMRTVLLGLPGSLQAYTLEEFRSAVGEYDNIGEDDLRGNLISFIKEIAPVAEESGVFMAIHPDDPPRSLLGLPRVVRNEEDVQKILGAYDSPSNGLTLCTGSFGAGYHNDLVSMAEHLAQRTNFVHLRNVVRNAEGDFLEENHLEGDVDMYGVMKALLLEQKRRADLAVPHRRMPMRPDHGHLMAPDETKPGIYPGYSLFGRMRALAELRGMEMGIVRSLGL